MPPHPAGPRQPKGRPRTTPLLLPALAALLGLTLGDPAPAVAQAPDISYSRFAVFRIPFQPDSGERRLRQVQLYVSTNQGQSWQAAGAAAPEQRYFEFRAPQDGLYWFAVRTVDVDGRPFPASMDGIRPGLKVVVDTQAPQVRLRELPPRDAELAVEWEVRDENLDPTGLRLEYRPAGGGEWTPLAADIPATGQHYFRPTTNAAVEVRLRARDRADNQSEDKVVLGGGAGRAPVYQGESSVGRPPESALRVVNSTRFGINYEIKETGPSGVSAVELWYTQDLSSRVWHKYREESGPDVRPPFQVEVNGEGLYGFTLVVRSGVGLGARPPQIGDQPQVWVEVDLTKPVVRIGNVDVGRGADFGRLTVNWSASDKNLGRQPITLSYAEQTSGPWTTIAASLESSGRYVWEMPKSGTPYRFFVRVEAQDKAGNVGADLTANPVIVDLAQPKGVILSVDPMTK